jgi:hypothetical protein
MKKKDASVPATKRDLSQGMAVLRGDMVCWKSELRGDMDGWKNEIVRHFDVVVEDLRHDMIGMHHDQVEVLKDKSNDHEHRIKRLESRAGFAA